GGAYPATGDAMPQGPLRYAKGPVRTPAPRNTTPAPEPEVPLQSPIRAIRAVGFQIVEEFAVRRQYHRRIAALQSPLIGGERTVEFKEFLVCTIGFGENPAALCVRFTTGDFGIAGRLGDQFDHGTIRRCTHARRRFLTTGDFIGRFAFTLCP